MTQRYLSPKATKPRPVLLLAILMAALSACDEEASDDGQEVDGDQDEDEDEGEDEDEDHNDDAGDDNDDAVDKDQDPLVRVRVANLIIEAQNVDVCWGSDVDGGISIAGRLHRDALDYGQVSNYLELPLREGMQVSVVESGSSCDAPLASANVERLDLAGSDSGNPEFRSLVVFGDTDGDDIVGFRSTLLADESDQPPTEGAKMRGFHVDPEAPPLDTAIIPPMEGADPVFVFLNIGYGATPEGSGAGTVTPNGYVTGLPSVPFPIHVFRSGTDEVLAILPQPRVLEEGFAYTAFPAGKAFTGQPEALVCKDEVILAENQALADCVMVPGRHP